MGTKLYIKTFGCQMNEYDSEKTVDILKDKKNRSFSLRGKIECVVTDVLGNKNDSGVDVLSKILFS